MGRATNLRNAQMDAITTFVGNAGKFQIYDGARPATGGAATTKLAEFTTGSPFAPGSAAGVLSPTIPSATTGLAAGTATWARQTTSGGTFCTDYSAGVVASTSVTGSINTPTVTVGSAAGISIGMYASGTGIASGATVVDVTGLVVTLSKDNTGAVSGTGTFSPDVVLNTATISIGVAVSVTSWTESCGNA